MASAEIALTNLLAREQLLTNLLEPIKENYDYILIDCPPSLGIVTTNAFLAADEIIVPMTPELLPLKGMRMLDSFVLSLQKIKPSLHLSGVFIARYNHRKLNKVVEQAVKDRYNNIIMYCACLKYIARGSLSTSRLISFTRGSGCSTIIFWGASFIFSPSRI